MKTLSALALAGGVAVFVHAAEPFESATLTIVQNKVALGHVERGRSIERPAAVRDVVRGNNFVVTEVNARAEMEYTDGSLVRLGQNTIFSFESGARTVDLKRGSALFYAPKGGGEIKTPTLTAAVTGSVDVCFSSLTPQGAPIKEGIGNVEGGLIVQGKKIMPGEMFLREHVAGKVIDKVAKFTDDGILYTMGARKFKIVRALQMPDMRDLTHQMEHLQIGVVDRRVADAIREQKNMTPIPAVTPEATPESTPRPTPATPQPTTPTPTPPICPEG